MDSLVSSGQLSYLSVRPSRKGKSRSLDVEAELGRVLSELQAVVDKGDYRCVPAGCPFSRIHSSSAPSRAPG